MRTQAHGLIAWLLATALSFGPGFAQAAPQVSSDKKVEQLVKDAQKLFEAGDYAGSAKTLLQAYEIKPVVKLLFNVARTYDKGNEEELAMRYYQRYIDNGDDTELVRKASNAMERLRTARDARLAAENKKAQEEKEKQAAENARKDAEAEKAKAEARAAERARREAEARLEETPPQVEVKKADGPPVLLISLGAAAVVGAAAGVVLGLQAKGARADFDAATDVAGKQSNMDRAKSRALGADIAFGVAGAAAITGVVVFLLSGDPEDGAGFALGPTGASYTFTWGR